LPCGKEIDAGSVVVPGHTSGGSESAGFASGRWLLVVRYQDFIKPAGKEGE